MLQRTHGERANEAERAAQSGERAPVCLSMQCNQQRSATAAVPEGIGSCARAWRAGEAAQQAAVRLPSALKNRNVVTVLCRPPAVAVFIPCTSKRTSSALAQHVVGSLTRGYGCAVKQVLVLAKP